MIYVASSWRNRDQPRLVQLLRGVGYGVYDFREEPGAFSWADIDPSWMTWTRERFRDALVSDIAIRGFARDYNALVLCGLCVLLLPSGRSAHLEAGIAHGMGRPVIIYMAEEVEPELMYRVAHRSWNRRGGGIVFNDGELLDHVRREVEPWRLR